MNLFTLLAKIALDDSEYTSGVDSATRKGKKFASGLKSTLSGAAKAATAAVGVASTAVVGLGKIAFDYNSEIESYTSNFTVMLGDAEKAAQKVEELKKMGAETPFELGDLAKATTTLMAFNVSSDKSTGILKKLGDISLGNSQKLETLTRAYGKMNASQKVSLEDINMMIDSGFNPLLLVAEKTGESMEDLYARISKGDVAFSEIEEAIDKATSAGGQYYKGMETASKTTEGMISTLKDNTRSLIGEVFEPVTKGITETVLPGAITAIDTLTEAYRENGIRGMARAASDMMYEGLGGISDKLPDMLDKGAEIVDFVLDGIYENSDEIGEGAGDLLTKFADRVVEDGPEWLAKGGLACLKVIAGFADSIPDIADKIPDFIDNIGTAISEHGEELADLGWRIIKGIGVGILKTGGYLLDLVLSLLQKSEPPTAPSRNGGPPRPRPRPGGGRVDGVHAGGLDYVPFDGYIAELHKGEKVLTAKEARRMNFGDVHIHIDGARYENEDRLAEAISVALQRLKDEDGAVYA